MAQTRHIADAIADQIVDRLRWGVPTTATYTETGNNSAEYTVGRDRDAALAASMLPFVDVRIGSEQAIPAKIGTYTAEMQVHLDIYCKAYTGIAVSRELERLRLLTQSVMMRPSFKGSTQTEALLNLNMGPYVHSLRLLGAEEISAFQEGETGIGHLRTTYVVRYSVPLPGLQLPDENPSNYYQEIPAWNAWATTEASISSNVATAPDLTNAADRLVPSATNSLHSARRSFVTPETRELFASIFVKAEGAIDKVSLYPGGDDTLANFDLTNLTVTTQANVTSAQIDDAGNGWRVLTVQWPGGGETYTYLRQYVSSGSIGFEAFLGDGVSGVLFWNESIVARNAYIVDNNTASPSWRIHMPAEGNGLNSDLTTFIVVAFPNSFDPSEAEGYRDGLTGNGTSAPYWHGFQAYPGEVVSGSLSALPEGSYFLGIAEVARGILNTAAVVTLDLTVTS